MWVWTEYITTPTGSYLAVKEYPGVILQDVTILSVPQADGTYFTCLANDTPSHKPLHPTGVEGVWFCPQVEAAPCSSEPPPRPQQPFNGDCADVGVCGHSGTPSMPTALPRPHERVEVDFEDVGVCGHSGTPSLPTTTPPRPYERVEGDFEDVGVCGHSGTPSMLTSPSRPLDPVQDVSGAGGVYGHNEAAPTCCTAFEKLISTLEEQAGGLSLLFDPCQDVEDLTSTLEEQGAGLTFLQESHLDVEELTSTLEEQGAALSFLQESHLDVEELPSTLEGQADL